MPNKFDVIIIGSGPAGAHSALPLVKKGFKVAMIDVGNINLKPIELKFGESFEEIRKNRIDQTDLFLGEDLSAIPQFDNENSHSDAMTSGNKKYISKDSEKLLPILSKEMNITQSLAKGGLSETWGAVCDIFDDEELEALGIPKKNMKKHYQEVINEIGISGKHEGYETFTPLKIDSNARRILKKYENKVKFKEKNFILKQPLLALLSENMGKRKACQYKDNEFWMNQGDSIYRARFSVEEMEKKKNFKYFPDNLVLKFKETNSGIEIFTKNISENIEKKYSAKYLIFASGSVNTVKILLKSFNLYDLPIPFITKTHYLIPSLQLSSLGHKGDVYRHSLCQLAFQDNRKNNKLGSSFSQIYSYKSLLLYKLLEQTPLPMPEAMSLISIFAPSFIIVDTRFPSFLTLENRIVLKKSNSQDIIEILNEPKNKKYSKYFKEIKKFLFRLGLIPIKVVETPLGSTAHYAGGASFLDKNHPLGCEQNGRLMRSKRVYIADASTWRALPAKPLGLTIMANANRIANELSKKIKK
ncbi:hypothetical protein COU54_04455 [Candidatus Pacearchaeota archaeon CG10_big_fil_rev_8_21_14_0_10_31_24]|nr:MAG: hypothetical protein COU54_04455 [Candidatus Pacearchaeota archaeon CG10_big_fil_rev_8_21_14_0_10_31_24]